jgi:predicted aconitase with swiveling domain
MIDGIITATAVVATMPLIHNNAGDFASFRSAIWTRTERFPNVGPLELPRCAALA